LVVGAVDISMRPKGANIYVRYIFKKKSFFKENAIIRAVGKAGTGSPIQTVL
jgi:hypothetical protein